MRQESATDTDKDWFVPMHDVMISIGALAAIALIPPNRLRPHPERQGTTA